jgi:hypothetical protein
LPRPFFMLAQTRSIGFRSGAQAGSWITVSQPGWAPGELAHHGTEADVQAVPDHDDRGSQLAVRCGDQIGVTGFGPAPALAPASPVDTHPGLRRAQVLARPRPQTRSTPSKNLTGRFI